MFHIQKKSFKIKNLYLHFKFPYFMEQTAKRPFHPGTLTPYLTFKTLSLKLVDERPDFPKEEERILREQEQLSGNPLQKIA